MNVLLTLLLLIPGAASQEARGTLSGRLLFNDGTPAANVNVALSPAVEGLTGSALLNMTRTDSEGRYLIEKVPAGRYYIAAGIVSRPTYYPGTPTRPRATAISFLSGEAVQAPDFRIEKRLGWRVQGKLGGQTSEPPSLIALCHQFPA